MASLNLLRNPLKPLSREQFTLPAGTRVIDWLQEHHPKGFGMPVRFYVNGREKELDDLDYAVTDDDVVILALMPGIPAAILTTIAINLAIALVLSAASFAINYFFFQPKQSAGGAKGKQVSLFDVSTDQNAAKLGDPIPVVYGTVLTAPDYISQPYTFFQWSQAAYNQAFTGVQYLDMLMCIGQGNIDVSQVLLGDTDAATMDSGIVTWRAFKPSQHLSTMGTIASAMGGGFHENVITSPEVSNQEFIDAGDSAGYFATCKPGQKGSKFQIDITFPSGLVDPDSDGDIRGRLTQFTVYWQERDDNDAAVGSVYSTTITCDTRSGNTITTATNGTGTSTSASEKNQTVISSPFRRSYMITPVKSARWAVKISRITSAPNSKNGISRFIWTGLRLFADYPAGTVYGNVTLLAVRIKASQGLGNDASARIRVKASRRLPPPAGGTEAASTSGADAFADVYTDAIYGANRPRSELDTATLASLRTKWASYQFNYVFRDGITVWEALRTITTPFGAEPLPVGPVMSVVQDGVKSVRSALFTDANIIADSFSVGYGWDQEGAADGVEIEYVEPKDFSKAYTRYPTGSLRPDQYTLPGVTNATHAAQYARLTWQRRQSQRQTATFDTELEGLLLQLGDRIGISHNVPKWGDGGQIIGASGNTLTLDHALDWSGGSKQMLISKPDGSVAGPFSVIRGTADYKAVATGTLPTIHVDDEYDYNRFAFGSSTTLVRDFIVTTVSPQGENTVTVEAMNYAPGIFTGAMSYMAS